MRKYALDIAISLAIVVGVSGTLIVFDVFTVLHAFAHQYENWVLHNFLSAFVSLLVAGTVLALRQISILHKLAEDLEHANANIETQEAVRHHQEKLAALGQLSGGMAHEISNALQPAIGLGEIVQNGLKDSGNEKHHEYMGLIVASALHAQSIIENVLDFTHEKEMGTQTYPAFDVMADALDFSKAIMSTSIDFDVSKPETIRAQQPLLECDKSSLIQIFVNILENAANAMNGKSVVSISIAQTVMSGTDNTPAISVAITDTGCGMNADVQQKIFDPFFTTKDLSEGTGLGLSSVYGLMHSHGGRITVTSCPGQGSTFTLYFPIFEENKSM